ncbi:hypothetical protein [Paenibacillus lautus]|uniref:hypothetical protein n=1 Tax=Paenibacillus lautus TaxID=1401 RepID=UPI003D9AAD85
MSQTVNNFEKEITKRVRMKYLLHLPDHHEKESSIMWPLILFLHGAGERGDDLELVKAHGIPMIAERDPSFPFITISPQCPEDYFLEC